MSKAAEIELRLEKAQRKTAQAGAHFASFQVGDRVEVTNHLGAKQGTIYQVGLKHRHLTVVFDGHPYKTTLSRADYLTRQYQIKKLEEVSQVVQKREIPSKAELEAKFAECGYKIDKLAKHYCIAWLKARAWLQMYGIIDAEGSKKVESNDKSNDKSNYSEQLGEPEEQVEPEKPCNDEKLIYALDVLSAGHNRIEFALNMIFEKLNVLEQQVDQLQTSAKVEFKDVADLAERMHRVWTDARRG